MERNIRRVSTDGKNAPAVTAPARRRQPDDTVDSLFQQGKILYEKKKFQEAEDVWKSALQINHTDMRVLLYYAAMLRENGDSEKADQLLEQTMGDWTAYTTVGMKEPASPQELYRRPKLVSPKKDMEKLEFVRKSNRSHVKFYSVKNLKKKIASMELSQSGESGDFLGDGEEEGGSYDSNSMVTADLEDETPSFAELNRLTSSELRSPQAQSPE